MKPRVFQFLALMIWGGLLLSPFLAKADQTGAAGGNLTAPDPFAVLSPALSGLQETLLSLLAQLASPLGPAPETRTQTAVNKETKISGKNNTKGQGASDPNGGTVISTPTSTLPDPTSSVPVPDDERPMNAVNPYTVPAGISVNTFVLGMAGIAAALVGLILLAWPSRKRPPQKLRG